MLCSFNSATGQSDVSVPLPMLGVGLAVVFPPQFHVLCGQPTRYQITTVMNRDKYHFSEVCPKLKPFSVTGGHYQMVCIEPRILFFVFERRDITAAPKALKSFVRKERQVVRIDEILSCPSDQTSTLVTIHFQFAIIPCNVLNRVQSILPINQSHQPVAFPSLRRPSRTPHWASWQSTSMW